MAFTYHRAYRGPLEAALLDWAGTTMDFGCVAPAVVFVEVFRRQRVPITMDEARVPMGAHKRVHIQRITEIGAVRERWRATHDRLPTDADVQAMFDEFVPLQLACLGEYSQLIPGTVEVVDELRRRGMKIGSTSGYTTAMMDINLRDAKRQGYQPDATVCASDVPGGRPYPFMCLKNAIDLQVTTVHACVKIDDTVPGIEEGLNAAMWTIGLAITGNEVGLSREQWEALPAGEQALKRQQAYERLHRAGAHYVVDGIADVLPCIDDIQRRLREGERP